MKKFLKDMCGKLAISALQVYRDQKIHEIRNKAADVHELTVKKAALGVRIYLIGIMTATLCAVGVLLLPVSWVVYIVSKNELTLSEGQTIKMADVLGNSANVLLFSGVGLIVFSVVVILWFTRLSSLRKILSADEREAWLRGN